MPAISQHGRNAVIKAGTLPDGHVSRQWWRIPCGG
jgi:hypothetical protein